MSISKPESDIILNKANIALARSQRLVASWLPAPTPSEQNPKSTEELQREEDEIFTAVPETLGVGAPLPTKAVDGSWNRTELDSNDKLRKQLLGRNYQKVMAARQESQRGGLAVGKPGSKNGLNGEKGGNGERAEDTDDEDEGRTALIGRKTKQKNVPGKKKGSGPSGGASAGMGTGEKEVKDADGVDGEGNGKASAHKGDTSSRPVSGGKGRKKATSFLDEILAERSKKRRKK